MKSLLDFGDVLISAIGMDGLGTSETLLHSSQIYTDFTSL